MIIIYFADNAIINLSIYNLFQGDAATALNEPTPVISAARK